MSDRGRWPPKLVAILAVLGAGLLYLLTVHPDVALALTAVGTVGAAVAAAGSARQSAAAARSATATARENRRLTTDPYRPTLKIRPVSVRRTVAVGIAGDGLYDHPTWEPMTYPGRSTTLPIEFVPGAIRDRVVEHVYLQGVTSVVFTVRERRSRSTWRSTVHCNPTGIIWPSDEPVDLVEED